MKPRQFLVAAWVAASALVASACQTPTSTVIDELGDEFAGDQEDIAKAADVILTLANDDRECASPQCGGVWAKRANYRKLRCDGAWRKECYVADIDVSAAGVPAGFDLVALRASIDAGHVLARGLIAKAPPDSPSAGLNVLYATEVWVSGTDTTPEGIYVAISPSGVRCIAAPCPTFREQRVNSTVASTIAEIDFGPSGATEEQAGEAIGHAFGQGLIIAGDRFRFYENGNPGRGRTATQFFTRLRAPCFATGCSGQVCADEDVVTTCEYRDEYACYSAAECRRQEDGQCGFTPTPELQACLEAAAAP